MSELTREDIPRIWWAGNPGHIDGVAAGLERAASGEVEYLAVRAPTGDPVAMCRISYAPGEDGAEIGQLVTHWQLQGLGLATRLIADAEARIRRRGRARSILGVEDDNPRARALYERLGYRPYGREQSSWEVTDEDGSTRVHTIDCVMLEKLLA